MNNKLIDLNNHLFVQLERLTDEDLKGEELQAEIERSKAVSNIALVIVGNAKVALDAQVAIHTHGVKMLPAMIGAPVPAK